MIVWTPTNPEIISITPAVGPKVTVTGLKWGTTDITVEADGAKKLVELIAVRRFILDEIGVSLR